MSEKKGPGAGGGSKSGGGSKAGGRPPRAQPSGRRGRGARPGGPAKSTPQVLRTGAGRGRDVGKADARWIYGHHAVAAALANPRRKKKRLLATDAAFEKLGGGADIPVERVGSQQIDHVVPPGAAHQGVALQAEDLGPTPLGAFLRDPKAGGPMVILDQVTDPQNVGAAFRAALAFGARAIVMQDRKSPPLTGALAKAAAGAADILPHVREVNLTRTVEALRAAGFFTVGLAGEADDLIQDTPRDRPICLVLGSEGEGLRRLVAEACDRLARIPIDSRLESLNVSTAAAIGLFALTR